MKKIFFSFLLIFSFLVGNSVLAVTTTVPIVIDTEISSDDPNSNFFGADYISIRGTASADVRRTLMRFTTPNVDGVIDYASIFIYSTFCDGSPVDAGIYPLTQIAWVDSEVTYNDYSSGNAWSSAGGDFGTITGENVDTACVVGTWQEFRFDTSTLDFNTTYNYLLKLKNETGGERYLFESSFNADPHDPYLYLDYSDATTTPTTTPIVTSTDQETLVFLANSQMQMYIYFFVIGLFFAVFLTILFVLL